MHTYTKFLDGRRRDLREWLTMTSVAAALSATTLLGAKACELQTLDVDVLDRATILGTRLSACHPT